MRELTFNSYVTTAWSGKQANVSRGHTRTFGEMALEHVLMTRKGPPWLQLDYT